MSKKALEVTSELGGDQLAAEIARKYTEHNTQRQQWLDQKLELRNYIFAIDTSTTTNSTLPWKNKTTLPKLCQIRDNLHANYSSALFPNDNWIKWEGATREAVTVAKRKAIEGYMANKVRESGFRTEINKLLYDYIDYGNAFYETVWVNESHTDPETGEIIPGYIGPKLVRISPNDLVFNPMASTFDDSYKITRYVKTMGEMKEELDSRPDLGYNREVIEKADSFRGSIGTWSKEDLRKLEAYSVDGFGSYQDYLQSGYVEILEFEGNISDNDGSFLKNHLITVIDRQHVVRKEGLPTWTGKSTKGHVGWRFRPDNLYAMGPLDNLVGMQYRIDHLENLKADAMDLAIHPPLVIAGNVEEFNYGPGEEIYVGEGGQVTELGKNLSGVMGANNEISALEQKMEEMAGAPKQAMGIRTPGEKTAYEVQTLEMAASRIFQNKIANFEINLVEPALNRMLELARRNMDGSDLIRIMDDDFGVLEFLSVTKTDITSSGKLRPIGARHFAAQAVMMQNLMGIVNSGLWADPTVKVHFSGKKIASMVEELLGLESFDLVSDNVAIAEQAETAQLTHQAQEDIATTDQTPMNEGDGGGVAQGGNNGP